MKRSSFAFGVILLGLSGLIVTLSCVKSSTSSNPNPGPGNPNTINVGDNFFSPPVDTFALASGSVTVSWKNNGSAVHTATSNSGAFDTGNISPGQTKSITFTTAGSYPYHCIHHSMNGTVVIQ